MYSLVTPKGYESKLSVRETERRSSLSKTRFNAILSKTSDSRECPHPCS